MFFFRKRSKQQQPPAPHETTPNSKRQLRTASTSSPMSSTKHLDDSEQSQHAQQHRPSVVTTDTAPDGTEHPLADVAAMSGVFLPQTPRTSRNRAGTATAAAANASTLSAESQPQASARSASGLASKGSQRSDAPPSARGARHLDPGDDELTHVGSSSGHYGSPRHGATLASRSQHHEIAMDFGDVYTGSAAMHPTANVLVPHGNGTLQSASGKHCYVGNFKYQLRDGLGKLVTDRYAMWAQWRDNRPNLSASMRIDYANGDRYSGYCEALSGVVPVAATPTSKFSAYIAATTFVKSGWGEAVYNDGRRYFGQWHMDQAAGFGCLITPQGDRYVGLWRNGSFQGSGVHFARNGLVYDGLWQNGGFQCSNADVIFARQVRLRADWDDVHRFKKATVVMPDRRIADRPFHLTSQFDPLLLGASEATRKRAVALAAPLRAAANKATTVEEFDTAFAQHLKDNDCFVNTLKIVRRCFYFYYGTCGNDGYRGAGQKGNKLGWCYLRKNVGGCIHRGQGDAIVATMVHAALGDVLSFVLAARRWFLMLLGDAADVVDRLDCAIVVNRRILDAVLPLIHAPLLNLYVHSYVTEQLELDSALLRLRNVSMDDVGVSFARNAATDRLGLFLPYADAVNSFQRLPDAMTFGGKLAVLSRWTSDIDDETRMNQMRMTDDEEMAKVYEYLRKRRAEKEQVDPTLPLPPKNTPTVHSADPDEAEHTLAAAFNVTGGSLDDLLPIHQFVFLRSRVPHLVAHSRLIADLCDVDWFVDLTSRDSFCVTTLRACIAVVAEMHPVLKDATGVLTPSSSVVRRVTDAIDVAEGTAQAQVMQRASHALAAVFDWLAVTAAGDAVASCADENLAETEGAVQCMLLPCDTTGEASTVDALWCGAADAALLATAADAALVAAMQLVCRAVNVDLVLVAPDDAPAAGYDVRTVLAGDVRSAEDATAVLAEGPRWVAATCATLARPPRELQLVTEALAAA